MNGDEVALRRAGAPDADDVADVWLRSFATALPTVRRAHDDDGVRNWFSSVLVPRSESWVAVSGNHVVGLLVREGAELEQLYLDPS
ncbi:hypothetical protein ACWFMI_12030 [Nocardiopsis terrae]